VARAGGNVHHVEKKKRIYTKQIVEQPAGTSFKNPGTCRAIFTSVNDGGARRLFSDEQGGRFGWDTHLSAFLDADVGGAEHSEDFGMGQLSSPLRGKTRPGEKKGRKGTLWATIEKRFDDGRGEMLNRKPNRLPRCFVA